MYVKVRAMPSAKKETCIGTQSGALEISVREPAERNMANRRIAELVARHFGVLPRVVRLVSGHRSRSKVFGVEISGGKSS